MMQAARFSIVCLSPQDWDADLPTNRHQIMRRAAARGHEVLFVETGDFVLWHLWRLVAGGDRRSRARRILATERVSPRVRVCKAINALPWGHKYRFARTVNAAATARRLRRLARALPQPVVLWVYDPAAAGRPGASGETFAVYDCVDDYAQLTRGDEVRRLLVAAADRRVARSSRLVFTTTQPLYARHHELNSRTYHVPNAGDYEHFAPAAARGIAADEVRDLPRPVIGFAGNMQPGKVDFELLDAIAAERPGWTLLLIGPARAGADEILARLCRRDNVHWLGWKPYAVLPRYVAAFDVGLCPYVWSDAMRSGFPLKLYEYLAAGKPVVASGNPDLAGMEPDVVLAHGAEVFVEAIEAALELLDDGSVARRRALAAPHTWESRTDRLLGLVNEQLAG